MTQPPRFPDPPWGSQPPQVPPVPPVPPGPRAPGPDERPTPPTGHQPPAHGHDLQPGQQPLAPWTPPAPASPPDPGQRPHPLSPFVQGWIGLVALIFFLGRDVLENGFDPENWTGARLWVSLGVLVFIGLITVVIGYFSWRYTRFVLDDDGLRIDHTFIQHQSDRVLYSKIQSVDIVQPFAARLLGLAALRVDAGGEAKKIQFLKRTAAEQLRDELLRRATVTRHPQTAPAIAPPPAQPTQPGAAPSWTPGSTGAPVQQPAPATSGQPGDPAPWTPPGQWQPTVVPSALPQEPTRVLVRLTPAQLVLGAVTSPEFVMSVVGLLAFGLVPYLITGEVWSAGIVVPAAFGLFGFISNRLIKEWNYQLSESSSGTVRIGRGLTTTVTQTVPVHRIQGFSISQSVLAKPFGLWRVQIEVLGYSGEEADEGGSTVLMPAGYWPQVLTALQAVWPGFDPEQVALEPLPERGRKLRPLTWHTHRWGLDDQVLLHRGGLVQHTVSVVHHARVQSVQLSQGPWQRRLGLASVHAHITNGPVTLSIPSMDAAEAGHLVRTELSRARQAAALAATPDGERPVGGVPPTAAPPAAPSSWDAQAPHPGNPNSSQQL
ncbi:PH domain-containing protein [Aestuariimicrobium ganziense]|uniref:PH domain-containing protein n=1 Tax=Aestuariimicrobium ganziense TaxID=2773677 RepID=UPI001943927F|nr:PH domain-containing protein [Aestuariimicrobium ganziense]